VAGTVSYLSGPADAALIAVQKPILNIVIQ
jgi:hypothetical protein